MRWTTFSSWDWRKTRKPVLLMLILGAIALLGLFNQSESRMIAEIEYRPSNPRVPRVAILIQTSPEYYYSRVSLIRQTWGPRVENKRSMKLLFITSNMTYGSSDMLASGCKDDYFTALCRVSFSLEYIYDKIHNDRNWFDFDWFFIADDDIYLLPDNFQRMIMEHASGDINYPQVIANLGCANGACIGFCGGAGIVLNRAAVHRIVDGRDRSKFKSLREELEANDPLCGRFHDVSFGYFLEHNRTNIQMEEYAYEPYPFVFNNTIEFLDTIRNNQGITWIYHYASRGAMHWLHHTVGALGTNVELNESEH